MPRVTFPFAWSHTNQMVAAGALRWSLVAAVLGLRVRALALLVLCYLPVMAAPAEYDGKPVASIRFDPAQQPLTLEQLIQISGLRTGAPLTAVDLRAAIQRLYSTGEYSDIQVDAAIVNGAVELKFITQPAWFVGHIAVSGVTEPPNAGQLTIATKLQLGSEYTEPDLKQAEAALKDVTRRNGYYSAVIHPDTQLDPATHQASFVFKIDSGKRAKFNGVVVTGDSERTLNSIIATSGWKGLWGLFRWKPLTETRLQSGLEGIRSWYQTHNHLMAKVTLVKLEYEPSTNAVTPHLDIDAGPTVKVAVKGARVSGGTQRNLLPIFQERAVDKDLLVEGERNLTQYFQSKGYFDAAVDFDTGTPTAGLETITYTVDRGKQHKLVLLEIRGNKYFDDATLRERMYVTPAKFLRFPHGRFSEDYLKRDVNTIRELYRSNGFRDVEVTFHEVDDYQGKSDQIAVYIDVKEGPQWFVSKLELAGAPTEDREHILSSLHSTEGQPYSDLNLATDRDGVLDYYYNNGYPDAKFEFTSKPSVEPYRMELRFVVTPGRRQYVRGVVVSGVETARESLVNQQITLKEGDPLSQTRMTESQKRLYDLGIFARVNAAIQNPEGDEPTKYVLYSIEEARRYSLTVGFGAEIARIGGGATTFDSPAGSTGFSPRVSLGISRLDFLGLGHTVSLQTRISNLQQRALFSYLAPRFTGNPDLTLQFIGLFDISRDVRTFSARREEGSLQLAQRLSRANSLQYRFTYRNVNVIGTPLITPELIPILSQTVRVGLLSGSFIQDRRDDPSDAHRGIYTTIDVGLASKVFGSQTGYGRLVARNATYYKLTKNLVLARNTFIGVIQRYSGLSQIPFSERFFSGGSTSQRAFPDNQAGPRDIVTGFPLGGNALFINNVELRFPLIGDNLGGVLFNDLGNVYSDVQHISLRWHQKNLQDFDYAVQAFGFGVRYHTPIGPVRVDLSLSPNAPRFFGFKGTRDQLLFGGGVQTNQRVNIFQFHFSLGQAF